MFDKGSLFQTQVLLPAWMFEQAKDKEQFLKLLGEYMRKSYPDYVVKAVRDGFAICERRG